MDINVDTHYIYASKKNHFFLIYYTSIHEKY